MDFTTLFPNGFDASRYQARPISNNPPSVDAWQFLTNLGYKPTFMQKGRLMRFPDPYDIAKRDNKGNGGWCIYNEFQNGDAILGFLSYGSWHDGTKETWSSIAQDYMTAEQRAAFHDSIESARRVRDEQERIEKEQAKAKFVELWDKLNGADSEHGYLTRKGIKAHGIKQYGDKLIIPMVIGEELVGLQEIDESGEKKFKRHSTKGYYIIGEPDGFAYLCEGYSTGASIHEATGKPVVVAFDAGNLFNVCSLLKDKLTLVICADNDHLTGQNTGLIKAQQCADTFGLKYVLPNTTGTDFNDMAQEHGLEAVAEHINNAMGVKQTRKERRVIEATANNPHGTIGLIADYYNATSGNDQRGFAIQTALAIGSIVCGRNFKTDTENWSSIYLLNVGKTATGKEHGKTIIERVLRAGGMDNKVIGDGFTSSGGLMTELLRKPRAISVIDEFGMYLDAAKNKGNTHQKEANSYLMQAISRTHDVLRAKNYSAMATKDKDINDRYVCNPALTLVGITTPSTFFDAITDKDIHSGFLNRFIVSISDAQPAVRKRVEQMPVPDSIVNWIRAISKRAEKAGAIEVAVESPNFITIKMSDPAYEIQQAFEKEMVDEINRLSASGLDGLAGRANEMAMRLSLILALGRDPNTTLVGDIDMLWATNYMRQCYKRLYDAVSGNIVANQFEADKNKILEFIGNDEATKTDIGKRFRGHPTKYLEDLVKSLVDAGEIQLKINTGVGRPSQKYVRTEIT